jgi:proliferating cell nuclear antigen
MFKAASQSHSVDEKDNEHGINMSAPACTSTNGKNNGNVLTIKTVQIAPMRTLLTALKDILLESNITFCPDGIRIINMDKSHTMLAHMFLAAENFEEYDCQKEKIIIGVNMFHLFKLVNTIDNDDTLTIYIENKDYNEGIVSFLGLKFENGDIKQCKTQKLRLIEPEPEELIEPNVTFSSVINLPSADFQKIIRDLSFISDKLEIKSVGNELIFRCAGQFATAEVTRVESTGSMEFIHKQNANKIIQGEFSLKNLGYFIKCTNLCSQIEMYLENDLPLVVKYYVASLGEIKLCLAPLPSSA